MSNIDGEGPEALSTSINHAARAVGLLAVADRDVSDNWPLQTGEHKADIIAQAQVHATLALVEQQRIANLIALGTQSSVLNEELFVLRDEAAGALVTTEITPATPNGGPDEFPAIHLNIREGLGL